VREISKAYRITPAGRYYIRYLTSRFAYIDLVYQDTPIADDSTFEKLKALFKSHELSERFERVRTFLKYLDQQEEDEYSVVISKSESIPLRKRFMPEYTASFESDVKFIGRSRRKIAPAATPYSDAS